MTKPEKVPCTDQREIHAQNLNLGLTKHNWSGVTIEEFVGMLDACFRWYRDVRMKGGLDYRSPMQYRRDLGLLAA